MPLITCRTCGAKFTGLECPDCGRHLSARGCFYILIALAALLGIVSILFPVPPAPGIEEGPGGEVTYVLEPFRHSSREALGLTLFILFVAVTVCRIRLPHLAPPTPSTVPGIGGAGAMMFGSLGRVLRTCLLGLLAVVAVCLVVLKPLGEFRALTVTDRGITLHTLYHTRSLRLDQVLEAASAPELEDLPSAKRFQLRLLIRRDARTHRSAPVRLSRKNERFDEAIRILESAIADIHRRKDRTTGEDRDTVRR